jgi:D-alanyl-D-alanine dipeptidase
MRRPIAGPLVAALVALGAFAAGARATGAQAVDAGPRAAPRWRDARQLVLVVTPAWDSTSGTLRRYVRNAAADPWQPDGSPIPIVVGRTGLAWGADTLGARSRAPRKREGDGRAPAGMFPLEAVFGFAPATEASWARLPYLPLAAGTDCVDDVASPYYNTIADRASVPGVRWMSAEHMREIEAYRIGVVVGYNAHPPRPGRGSCIFLHIWGGPRSVTNGCTAMPAADVESLAHWLDRDRRPMLVQLPAAEYARLRARWRLP